MKRCYNLCYALTPLQLLASLHDKDKLLLQRLEEERDSALKQLLCKHQEGVRRQTELSEARFAAEGTSKVRRPSACLSIHCLICMLCWKPA